MVDAYINHVIVLSNFHVEYSLVCSPGAYPSFLLVQLCKLLTLLTFTLVLFKINPAIFRGPVKVDRLWLGLESISPDSYICIGMSSSEDLTSDVRTRFSSHNPFLHLLHVWDWCATEAPSVYSNYWLRISRQFIIAVAWMRRFYCFHPFGIGQARGNKGGEHSMM